MNPFEHTQAVAFELSNFCNLAWFHQQCPLHREMASPFTVREPRVLDARIIWSSLLELAEYDYRGVVNFHGYNEPLLDPRLFQLIEYASSALPEARIEILTNGTFLTRGLAVELKRAGVTKLAVTLYVSAEDRARRSEFLDREIAPEIALEIGHHELDNRAGIYERPEYRLNRPCGAPLKFVTVTCTGMVALCCFDWKRTATFGDLSKMTLGEALASEKSQETYRRLKAGDRFLDVCQRCDTARGA